MRKTKIICTLGPATEKTETLRELMREGADIFRLNMSHAKHEWVREIVPRIRQIGRKFRGRWRFSSIPRGRQFERES